MNPAREIPVTTVIRLTPVTGKEQQLLSWFDDIAIDAARFPGHQGSGLYMSMTPGDKQWLSIFTFDTLEHLDAWLQSATRANHLVAGAMLFNENVHRDQLVGLEFWFEDHALPKPVPPPKWKMALITGLIIFVLLNTLIAWFSLALASLHLPRLLISICSIALLISLMTWIVMPLTTHALRKYLTATKK